MGPATIRIFLADGTPLGIRVIEKSNWTGRGTDFARSDWTRARVRDDFAKPGVYVLTGVTDDGQPRVYVGEADVLATRISQHFAGPGAKEFWTRAVAFTSKDENLNKAHVRYLESRLVAMAMAAKRAQVENFNQPAAPSLSEYDRAEADAFLDEMLSVYPLLGVEAFTPAAAKPSADHPTLFLKVKAVEATGTEAPEGFVVFKGSRASRDETGVIHAFLRTQRAQLLESGVLAPDEAGLVLTQDYTFGSPSTASGVLLGRNSNGRVEWRDAAGTTLKSLQEKQAG